MRINLYFIEIVITFNKSVKARVIAELRENGKIPAIKMHRQLTKSNLKNAVDYVNNLISEGNPAKQFRDFEN